MKAKLLEDIAIMTNNGMEIIPAGTPISERVYDLDKGGLDVTSGEPENPSKSRMLRAIDQFTATLSPEERMDLIGPLGMIADAVEAEDVKKLRKLYAAEMNGGSGRLEKLLMQLVALGKEAAFSEEFINELSTLMESIKKC